MVIAVTKKKRVAVLLLALLLALWFSGFLPKQTARLVAEAYMSHQTDGEGYYTTGADFSGPHGSYFVYFQDPDGNLRSVGIYYRYLPIHVYSDSAHPQQAV